LPPGFKRATTCGFHDTAETATNQHGTSLGNQTPHLTANFITFGCGRPCADHPDHPLTHESSPYNMTPQSVLAMDPIGRN
jgi:hypothetical protein